MEKLKSGNYLEQELFPFNHESTPNGKIKLLFNNNHYECIETNPPLVVLMGAEPFAMISYKVDE